LGGRYFLSAKGDEGGGLKVSHSKSSPGRIRLHKYQDEQESGVMAPFFHAWHWGFRSNEGEKNGRETGRVS